MLNDLNQFIHVMFIIWALLIISKRLLTKKGDFEVFLWVLFGALYLVFDVFSLATLPFGEPVDFIVIGLLYTVFFYDIKALFKRKDEQQRYQMLQKNYDMLEKQAELLRQRFIATIDLLPTGIVFRTGKESMFGTDKYIELMDIDNNEFTYDAFYNRLHTDDRNTYETTIKKLSSKRNTYQTSYRFKMGTRYVWMKEIGTKITVDKHPVVISIVTGLDVKMYPKTDIEVLNNLPNEKAFEEHILSLNRLQKSYTLIFFELTNIPKVNEKYGRDIGDLMMGEFLKKLKHNFVKDAHSVYRLTGIRFALILKDPRKYEVLERALVHGGDLMNFDMQFGGIKHSIYPAFGIHHIQAFNEPIDAIIARVHKALNIALDNQMTENYFIIR